MTFPNKMPFLSLNQRLFPNNQTKREKYQRYLPSAEVAKLHKYARHLCVIFEKGLIDVD